MKSLITKCIVLLCVLSMPLYAEDEAQEQKEAKEKLLQENSQDLFLKASNWMYDQLIDPAATDNERQLAANTLRFAVTGSSKDYENIKYDIEQAYKTAVEFGRSKLRFLLNSQYHQRAGLYESICRNTDWASEPYEALDTILKAIYYNSNHWYYWATASELFTFTTDESTAIYDTEKAILYGKIAIALNPRKPYAFLGLVRGYISCKDYDEAIKVSSKALELAKFEDATMSSLRGDKGRSFFTGFKGICLLEKGDVLGAREYLQTAIELNNAQKQWLEPYIARAIQPLVEKAIPMVMGNQNNIGYSSTRNGQSEVLTKITDNSYAAMSGFQVNDTIKTINGFPISLVGNEYRDKVFNGDIDYAIYEVKRADKIVYYKLIKALQLPVGESEILGCTFDPEKLSIVYIAEGSPAAVAGWKEGDVLFSIDRVEQKAIEGVAKVDAVKQEIITRQKSEAIIELKRGDKSLFYVMSKKK